MSAGSRSGVNCTRPKERSSASARDADEQRLGEAGHADEERVAARGERDEHEVDDVVLADDAHADGLFELVARLVRQREQLDVARWFGGLYGLRARHRDVRYPGGRPAVKGGDDASQHRDELLEWQRERRQGNAGDLRLGRHGEATMAYGGRSRSRSLRSLAPR